MTIPFIGMYLIQKRFGLVLGYASLIIFWLSFEYLHLTWQIRWPWLNIGNLFAAHTSLVQWYEYTGISGGTLWVLVSNVTISLLISHIYALGNRTMKTVLTTPYALALSISIVLVIFIPIGVSQKIIDKDAPNKNNSRAQYCNVLIIQPARQANDEYIYSKETLISNIVLFTEKNIDTTTQLVLWPENTLDLFINQETISINNGYQSVFQLLNRHPLISLSSGILCKKNYDRSSKTRTATKSLLGNYYDLYNGLIVLHAATTPSFYYKNKLVPGVETLPQSLGFLEPIFYKFGIAAGRFSKGTTTTAFVIPQSSCIVAPLICYESIYGEYAAAFITQGANLLTVSTNDNWFERTNEKEEHFNFSKLRAIETRRYIVQCANTGITGIVNQYGTTVAQLNSSTEGMLKYSVPLLTQTTFYVTHGDFIYKISAWLIILFIILVLISYLNIISKRFA